MFRLFCISIGMFLGSTALALPVPDRTFRRECQFDGGFDVLSASDSRIRYRRSVDYGLTDIEVDGVTWYLRDLLDVHYMGRRSCWYIDRHENDIFITIDVEKKSR